MQAGSVVEEGSHEQLWSNTETVYHSLVALQEAATDRRDHLAATDDSPEGTIVKNVSDLVEHTAVEATVAMNASQEDCLKGQGEREADAFHHGELASKKPNTVSGKKVPSGGGSGEKKAEEALVRTLFLFRRYLHSQCTIRVFVS